VKGEKIRLERKKGREEEKERRGLRKSRGDRKREG
jgi:hypothetical protein